MYRSVHLTYWSTAMNDLSICGDACNCVKCRNKITEEAITTDKNNTPVGFASWCWGADLGYDDYQGMATERGIPPLNKADFEYVHNWWDKSLAASTKQRYYLTYQPFDNNDSF